MYDDYVASHENLEKLHVRLMCLLLQQDKEEVMYGQEFLHKLPPNEKHVMYTPPSWMTSGEMTHLRHSSTLYCNNKVQLSQHESHFSNFSLYPSSNVLHSSSLLRKLSRDVVHHYSINIWKNYIFQFSGKLYLFKFLVTSAFFQKTVT